MSGTEPNPGPVGPKYLCDVCSEEIVDFGARVVAKHWKK